MYEITIENRDFNIETQLPVSSEMYELCLGRIFQGKKGDPGKPGEDGHDATINGHNAITLTGDGASQVIVTPDPNDPTIQRISIDAYTKAETDRRIAEAKSNPYEEIEKKCDYLYAVRYGNIDYQYARAWFESHHSAAMGGACSVKSVNGLVGRNYDWLNDYQATFSVFTPRSEGRFAVMGNASYSGLTVQKVDGGQYSEDYKILPFFLQDGINEHGLFAEVNVVPRWGNDRVSPMITKRDSVCSVMLVRYILDHFQTVNDAVAYLRDYVEIYNPQGMIDRDYELHYYLEDATTKKVIEYVDGHVVVIESDILTNFHLYGVSASGDVYTPQTAIQGFFPTSQGIEQYGTGLERYNLLRNAAAGNVEQMRSAMDSVKFSKAYTLNSNEWFSEFVGGEIDVDTPADDTDFISRLNEYKQKWAERSKDDPQVWITCHSVIYDLDKKEMLVRVQEREDEYRFGFEQSGGASAYADLPDKPQIGGVTLQGNKTAEQLGLQEKVNDLATIRSNAQAGKTASDNLHGHSVLKDVPADAKFTDTVYDDTALKGRVTTIEGKIPAQASPTNQIADKDFVNSSIQNVAAYYITKDAAGNPFATKAELLAATIFYSGGQVRVPTRNDYLVVLADESKTISETGENPTTRYIYDNNVWSYQYIVNRSGLTAAQWAAVNSGITAAEVTRLAGLTDKVFVVEYGVTTYQQVIDAVDAGKHPICLYNGIIYAIYRKEGLYATLSACYGKYISTIKVSTSSVWSVQSITLQTVANKVTEWSATPNDTYYPSEKLVKDSLDGKQPLLTAGANITIENNVISATGGGGNNVFVATYNVTPFADIKSAADSNKVVLCKYANDTYILSIVTASKITFASGNSSGIKIIEVLSSNLWDAAGFIYEQSMNKALAITASSTNTQYPSAKATYDAINPAKQSAIPSGGMLPNVLYALGELSGTITMSLATPADANICNHYFFTFSTGTTAPTITWPVEITSWQGGSAPTINASKHYEVSVLNGVGVIMEV